jgi:hypothetical protein
MTRLPCPDCQTFMLPLANVDLRNRQVCPRCAVAFAREYAFGRFVEWQRIGKLIDGNIVLDSPVPLPPGASTKTSVVSRPPHFRKLRL